MSFPMQPLAKGPDGVIRFRENRIVRDLLDFATVRSGFPDTKASQRLSLNEIVVGVHEGKYTVEEIEQLYQLIGYSLSGYGGLSLVTNRTYNLAARRAKKVSK